jgi:hypothetical protein
MEKEFLEGCLADGMSLEAIGKRSELGDGPPLDAAVRIEAKPATYARERGWVKGDGFSLPPSRRDLIRSRGARLLPLQEVSSRSDRTSATGPEEDLGRRGRGQVRALRLFPLLPGT